MRHVLICLALATGLSACDGENSVRITTTQSSDDQETGVLKVIDTLQCPDNLGVLTRKGLAAAGGANCVYGGPKGSDVVLHLVRLDGRPIDDVLRDFEDRVSAELPTTSARLAPSPAAAAAPAAAANGEETASVQAPGVNIQTRGEDASVRLPGLRIETQGDNASVRIGGINIQSKDGQNARTETSTVSVDSNDKSTRVRTRAPGAATRMTYILSDDLPADAGWRRVGFEARGPAGGPIVIAVVRSKDRRDGGVFDDARDLVALNVGR
jgi:hypothetical protein